MLSPHTTHELQRLVEHQPDYTPNEIVRAELQQKSVSLLVAPSAMGKSTVMEEVIAIDDRFDMTGTTVSRERRANDNLKPYKYIPHTDEGLASFIERAKHREVVQYAIYPGSHIVYFSDVSDYAKEYSLLDTQAAGVAQFTRIPFKSVSVIGLIAQPDTWAKWYDDRLPTSNTDRYTRLKEAEISISWLLSQPEGKVAWVENIDNNPRVAAEAIIRITAGAGSGDPQLRSVAERCLAAARTMR